MQNTATLPFQWPACRANPHCVAAENTNRWETGAGVGPDSWVSEFEEEVRPQNRRNRTKTIIHVL